MEYFAFGETFIEEHKNSHNAPYKYNGKEFDEESGLYYYGARYYDPRISIWASTDPLSGYNPVFEEEHYIDGEHNLGVLNSFNHATYSYCYQNPINLFDPNGKQTKAWNRTMGALQGIGGLVEIAGSGIGTWFSGGTATPLMVPLALNGVDNTQAGFRQLWTGETTETMLHQGTRATAKALGASDESAENIATGADFATILIGNTSVIKNFKFKNVIQKLCFIEGTKIVSKDGLIEIEDIKIGDEVWSFNELNRKLELQKVTSLFQNTASELIEITIGNEKIVCTPEHPFFVANNWIEAKDLNAGDKLTLKHGSFVIIDALKQLDKTVKVYNFEVSKNHNYYVSELGVLTHNDCGTGWMKKDLYNQIGKISKELQGVAVEAISKGKVSRAKGVAGIKQLSGKGINGHMFELKLTGKFGAYRLLGDYETVIVNGKEIKTVIFKEIIKKK